MKKHSQQIKELAIEVGFDACGITSPKPFLSDRKFLDDWIKNNFHGEMRYMENHREKRTDMQLLHEGTKSVVVVLMNYFTNKQQSKEVPYVSKYAFGNDYHYVVKKRLRQLLERIKSEIADCDGIAFCDSAPIFERRLAEQAGLGWIGKNTQLINPQLGSFCFIGELLLDIELDYDNPIPNRCGNCDLCINSCPSKALFSPHKINATRCISYQTIEKKGEVDTEIKSLCKNNLFGCDICQNVCPWNKKAMQNNTPEFQPSEEFLKMTLEDWNNFTRKDYNRLFKNTPIARAGYQKIRNRRDEILGKIKTPKS